MYVLLLEVRDLFKYTVFFHLIANCLAQTFVDRSHFSSFARYRINCCSLNSLGQDYNLYPRANSKLLTPDNLLQSTDSNLRTLNGEAKKPA